MKGSLMTKSIAVFGAGPALGQAVARRYAKDGYAVALVARRPEPLERHAAELTATGATAHAVAADLSDTASITYLAEQIRRRVGDLDALYYGPSAGGAHPAATLGPQVLQAHLPVALFTLVALVQEFLPYMIGQRDGAILTATGASAVMGMPNFSGPGPGLAAQRNYLQSLQAEVADKGVYVGRLYITAAIRNSAWHAKIEADKAAGRPSPTWGRGAAVDPDQLADLLWTMHNTTKQPECIYPESASR
jgi:short-subunit dehydrogenase